MHFNLHKTFSTPHGGGGPGSGPVGVVKHLVEFLPGPIVDIVEEGDEDLRRSTVSACPPVDWARQVLLRSLWHDGARHTYIAMNGPDGLRAIAEGAVLNANYLLARLRDTYKVPYDRICMHEFVARRACGAMPPMCMPWISPNA
jgi:glycine dehydrogenase subunit 2